MSAEELDALWQKKTVALIRGVGNWSNNPADNTILVDERDGNAGHKFAFDKSAHLNKKRKPRRMMCQDRKRWIWQVGKTIKKVIRPSGLINYSFKTI